MMRWWLSLRGTWILCLDWIENWTNFLKIWHTKAFDSLWYQTNGVGLCSMATWTQSQLEPNNRKFIVVTGLLAAHWWTFFVSIHARVIIHNQKSRRSQNSFILGIHPWQFISFYVFFNNLHSTYTHNNKNIFSETVKSNYHATHLIIWVNLSWSCTLMASSVCLSN